MKKETQEAIDSTVSSIIKLANAGVKSKLGEEFLSNVDDDDFDDGIRYSTGISGLDDILGGGLAAGSIVELFGDTGSGKSTIAMTMLAEFQKIGWPIGYIDAEMAFDKPYAQRIGINTKELAYLTPDTGENAFTAIQLYLDAGVKCIMIDSVAAMVPNSELNGEHGESVSFDTPIYIRDKRNKFIDIVPISDLYGGGDLFVSHRWYRKLNNLETLTHDGWKSIKGVVKKRNIKNKPIITVRTSTGAVKVTPDHCLFKDGKEVNSSELKVFDRIDTYDNIPYINEKEFITADVAWLLGFWVAEGSTPKTCNSNRFEVCNVKLDVVEKCKDIVDKYFITRTKIREVNPGGRRQTLYILDCTSSKELGFLMQECCAKKSKIKKVPQFILNGSLEIKKAFLHGFWIGDGSSLDRKNTNRGANYHNNSMPVIAGLQYIMNCLGIYTTAACHSTKPEQFTLSELQSARKMYAHNEIRQFYNSEAPEFIWDMETEVGTFVSAFGNIVLHNSKMGLHARLMSQGMRMLVGKVKRKGAILIFLNQIRSNFNQYGDPLSSTGGKAIPFYANYRFRITRVGTPKEDDESQETSIYVIKNRKFPPFQRANVQIIFGEGIGVDIEALALKSGLIVKEGRGFFLNGEKIAKNKAEYSQFILDNPDFVDVVKNFKPTAK